MLTKGVCGMVPGPDRLVHQVWIRMARGILDRDIRNLFLLEVNYTRLAYSRDEGTAMFYDPDPVVSFQDNVQVSKSNHSPKFFSM